MCLKADRKITNQMKKCRFKTVIAYKVYDKDNTGDLISPVFQKNAGSFKAGKVITADSTKRVRWNKKNEAIVNSGIHVYLSKVEAYDYARRWGCATVVEVACDIKDLIAVGKHAVFKAITLNQILLRETDNLKSRY
jgi:hypothetical protein